MKFFKPKFWDKNHASFFSFLIFPIALLIKLLSMESTITISEIIQGKLTNIPPNPFPEKTGSDKEHSPCHRLRN